MTRLRATIAGLLTLTVGAALSGCGSSGDDDGDTVVIGLVCDTTGPGAGYATPACTATKSGASGSTTCMSSCRFQLSTLKNPRRKLLVWNFSVNPDFRGAIDYQIVELRRCEAGEC